MAFGRQLLKKKKFAKRPLARYVKRTLFRKPLGIRSRSFKRKTIGKRRYSRKY